jgi:hypothetical protein
MTSTARNKTIKRKRKEKCTRRKQAERSFIIESERMYKNRTKEVTRIERAQRERWFIQ